MATVLNNGGNKVANKDGRVAWILMRALSAYGTEMMNKSL